MAVNILFFFRHRNPQYSILTESQLVGDLSEVDEELDENEDTCNGTVPLLSSKNIRSKRGSHAVTEFCKYIIKTCCYVCSLLLLPCDSCIYSIYIYFYYPGNIRGSNAPDQLTKPIITITEDSPDSTPSPSWKSKQNSLISEHNSQGSDDSKQPVNLPRSMTDSNISYVVKDEVEEVSGSVFYILSDGQLNYEVSVNELSWGVGECFGVKL